MIRPELKRIAYKVAIIPLMRALLVLLVPIFAAGQALQIQPSEIRPGESATLTWDTGGAPAFVIGYGKVNGQGSAMVMPSMTTDFILATESARGIRYNTQRLVVRGAKGDDKYPSLSDFDVGLHENRSGIRYIDFQSAVWGELQKKGYGPKGDYVPKRPFVTIYTDFVLRQDLVSKEEKVRARRLALAVEINEPDRSGAIAFGVRPRLEFRYLGETVWRPDKDSAMAKSEAMKMLQSLLVAK
jgi:hypothetical protein